jgi:hypothetical protein
MTSVGARRRSGLSVFAPWAPAIARASTRGKSWADQESTLAVHDPTAYCQTYAPPNDRIRIRTNDRRLLALADRLWVRAVTSPSGGNGRRGELDFALLVVPDREGGRAGEGCEHWTIEPDRISVDFAGLLGLQIDLDPPRVTGQVSDSLLTTRPAMVARLLFEAPSAELLARRGYMVTHAGAVVGRAGAVVIRGRGGAGKSTLVAAAHRAGLGVLGDESILVARHDVDEIAAAVRDLTVLPDVARLLGIEAVAEVAEVGGRDKRRIGLFSTSTPGVRRARRVTTVLLGDRDREPAQLVALPAAQFAEGFRAGEIAQERWAGDPDVLAKEWGERGGYRLDGAADLSGAVRLLERLTTSGRDPRRES